ncbi:fructan 6-exohydrolase [Artemisia annua]|uniref:Fructan 6-exohydrolase n=1 Tax=Artemisia annua TaxID=35608 RepID=A0A2U1LUI0_ARTAN|nr:fructan 6-exohydrolase [Artemisia annua]
MSLWKQVKKGDTAISTGLMKGQHGEQSKDFHDRAYIEATADTTSNPLQLQPQLIQPRPQMYLTMQSRTGLGEELDHSVVDPPLICSAKDAATKGKFRPFGLLTLASSNLTEQTAIFFQIYKSSDTFLMCSDQSRWITRFFERFGGSKNCITSRVYQTFAIGDDAHLFAFKNGRKSALISELVTGSPVKSLILSSVDPVNNVKSSVEDSLPGLPENRHELPLLIIVSL